MPALRILRLGPHEALRHRRLGHEERARDLGRREPGERAQRERDLRFEPERGVTAREDEAEAVVVDAAVVEHDGFLVRVVTRCEHRDLLQLGGADLGPAQADRAARLRAAVVSHAPGVRGTPSRGHVSRARAKASCAHSSARSQSPVVRMSVATTCAPLVDGTHAATAASTSARATSPRSASLRSSPCVAPGIFGCDLDRLVEVLARRPGRSRPSAPWSRRTDRRR